jgi:hypothetical protein
MVIWKEDELKEMVENVHHDLGHYGKGSTVDAIRKRFVLPDVVPVINRHGKYCEHKNVVFR